MATFWEIAVRSVSNLFIFVFCLFVIFIYFPFLVLRAGFAFLLRQFLFIAFLLLFFEFNSEALDELH